MANEVNSSNPEMKLGDNGPVLEGFTPIPDAAHNPQIIDLTVWAIHVQNRDTTARLQFVKVLFASKKVLPESNTYHITFEASHLVLKLPNMYYEAEVLEATGNLQKLVELKAVDVAA